MVCTREEAAARALADVGDANVPDTCQMWTRGIFDAPSAGDQDGDRDADAVDGWLAEPVGARHPGDRNPPRGVPVSWRGGSSGHGHRAVSLGGGQVASTDAPTRARIGVVDLGWFETNWGLQYLGWSESITGLIIPQEDDMADQATQDKLDAILAAAQSAREEAQAAHGAIDALRGAEADRAKGDRKRDASLLEAVDALALAKDMTVVRNQTRKIKQILLESAPAEA